MIVASLATALIVASGVGYWLLNGAAAGTSVSAATFVGSETCAGCHHTEADLWHSSQHRLAMQHATENSVLGDFNDASFDYYGVHSRFFRRDGKYLVETDGPDGALETFEVKYTFGVDPLQQYLVEFRTAAYRRYRWPGIPGRRSKAASDGSTSTPTKRSSTTTSCIGPS